MQCRRVRKTDFILFGDSMPEKTIRNAQKPALRCDLMLAASSSLQVFPATDLPALAQRNGAALIIINREETHLDNAANLVLRANVTEALPAIVTWLPTLRAICTREIEVA